MIDSVRKEFKAAFFDNAAGTVVSDKMSGGNGVEVQLVKAIADDGFYGFGHKPFAPEILCPNVKDNHQQKNAESLAARGGACVCKENALDTLKKTALTLLSDGKKNTAMKAALSHYGKTDAAQNITDVILSLLPDIK